MNIARFFLRVLPWLLMMLTGSSLAQSVSALEWDFGTSSNTLNASVRHLTVTTDPVTLTKNGTLTLTAKNNTGGNSGRFYEAGSWPTSTTAPAALTGTRTSLSPLSGQKTIYANFAIGTASSSSSIANSTLQFRYQRSAASAPTRVQAVLVWQDGATYKRRYSAVTNVSASTSTTTWTTLNVPLTSGGDAFPTGTAIGGRSYMLEVHFFYCSNATNVIRLDDMKLLVNSLAAPVSIVTASPLAAAEQGYPYMQVFQSNGGSGTGYTYSLESGTLPAGLSISGDKLIGVPSATGTSNFTIKVTDSAAGTASKAFALTVNAAPTQIASGAVLAKWTFDTDGTGAAPVAPAVVGLNGVNEVTWGWSEGYVLGSNFAEGLNNTSTTPVGPPTPLADFSTRMRAFGGFDSADYYSTTRDSLAHLTQNTSSNRFAVWPHTNTTSIPNSLKTSTGDQDSVQFSITFGTEATGTLNTFEFRGLRWQKNLMNVDGTNGPRWSKLNAYYLNNSGVVTRWTSPLLDINAVFRSGLHSTAPGYDQFRMFKFDLSGLNTLVNATTTKYKGRKMFFDLYFYHDTGADLSNTTNPPVILLDDIAITGAISSPCISLVLGPSTSSLPEIESTVAYSTTLSAVGGTAPYTFSLQSGALPAGLTLSSSGVISGTPTGSGNYTVTVRAEDSTGCAGTRTYTGTVIGASLLRYDFNAFSAGTDYPAPTNFTHSYRDTRITSNTVSGTSGGYGNDGEVENGDGTPYICFYQLKSGDRSVKFDVTVPKPASTSFDIADYTFLVMNEANITTVTGQIEISKVVGGVATVIWRSNSFNIQPYSDGFASISMAAVGGTQLAGYDGRMDPGETFRFAIVTNGWGSTSSDGIDLDNLNLRGYPVASPDFGDATELSAASQTTSTLIKIGTATTDGEGSAPTSGTADADDTDGSDDEDSPVPVVTAGASATLTVPVTVSTATLSGATARLGVWVDWNGDGDVADTNETLTTQTVTASGNYSFDLNPPLTTNWGNKRLRIRLTEGATAPTLSGLSSLRGEVEDHNVFVFPTFSALCAPDVTPFAAFVTGSVFRTNGGDIYGTVGAADGVVLDFIQGSITKAFFVDPPFDPDMGGVDDTPGSGGTTVVPIPHDLSAMKSQALTLASAAAALTPTQTITSTINSDLTINATVANGQNVILVKGVDLAASEVLTLNGGPNDYFIVNVQDYMDFNGSAGMRLTGGLLASHVMVNLLPGATSLRLTGGAYSYPGTFVAVNSSTVTTLTGGAVVNGSVIAHYLEMAGGSSINANSFDCGIRMDYADYSRVMWSSSMMNNTLRIGSQTDSEITPVTTLTANGDDTTGVDDEDGVTMPATIGTGASVTIPVVVTNTSGAVAYLNAWIDYNNNGVLSDAGEQIATNINVANNSNGATVNVTFTVPGTASIGTGRGARFRLTSTSTPGHIGNSGTGEVEDYVVSIIAGAPADFGDYAGFPAATQTASNQINMGANATDTEATNPTTTTATADNTTGTNDEDLTMPTFYSGVPTNLVIPVTLNTGSLSGNTARINVFADWNGDGDASDTGETQTAQAVSTNGSSNVTFSITPPAGTTVGTKYLRLRLTEGSTAPTFGNSSNLKGEVEDYAVTVIAPDYGDYQGFASASQTADAAIRIGTNAADVESSNPTSGNGTADDTTGTDDEDLTIPTFMVTVPTNLVIPVTLNTAAISGGTSRINVFVDWNGDNDVADVGETQTAQTVATNGTSNVTFSLTAPSGTTAGTKYMRLRITEGSTAPAFSGSSSLEGEVEDYPFTVTLPTHDFGDFSSFGSASSTGNATLRIGASVDTETAATTDATATGDDTTGSDDEDGIMIPGVYFKGSPDSFTVNVTNTSGAVAYLNAWMDLNKNGVLTDAGEQLATNVSVPNGTNGANMAVNFTIPVSATTGTIGLRVRLTSTSSPGSASVSGTGEVEDATVTISNCPEFTLLVVNYNNNTLTRYSGADGSLLNVWTPSGLSAPNYGYRLSDNTFLVANGSSNTITKYNPFTGASLGTLVSSGSGLNFPYQMAVAADGSVYIANQNANNVLRFNQSTGAILGTVLSTSKAAGLVFDTAGDLYVTQNNPGGSLLKYTSGGALISTIATWPSGESPRGLAWGPDGRLYVNVRNGNTSTGRVDAISFPAATRTTFVNMDSGSNPYTGIKWGPDGNLYVVDYGENEVHVYSPAGATVRTITSSLSGPHAVAFMDCEATTQDFGDYSGFAHASSNWSASIRLGNESDTEITSRSTDQANGDDIDDVDDEDGVTLPASMEAGANATIAVKRLNSTLLPTYLNAWIDFNKNGVLTDPGEQVISDSIVLSLTNGTANYTVTIPSGATIGTTGMRVRHTSVMTSSPTGSVGTGEVEDYMVNIVAPNGDYGDHVFGTLAASTASQGVSTAIRLGTNATDAEMSDPSDGAANKDDTSGTNDEDLTLPALYVGSTTNWVIPVNLVTASLSGNTARIRVFADWNDDGDVADTNETLSEQTVSTNGASNVTFALQPPAGTVSGTKYIRVRIAESSAAVSFAGSSTLKGEVEDYAVTVNPPANDFGDYLFTDASSMRNGNLRIGATLDGEVASTTNANADGDDVTDSDDEDGVTVPATITQTSAGSLTVNVTNLTGSNTYLNAWIDFNRDGDLADSGEQITTDLVIANLTNGVNQTLNFTTPAAAVPGTAGVRVRLTSVISPGPDGADGNGEVEDYITSINAAALSIGNLVWNDVNNNGVKDAAELGVSGAVVQLFNPGADNAIGGTALNADTQVGTNVTTGATGGYGFSGLSAGNYYVKVTPPLTTQMTSGTPDTADNADDGDNNGAQPGGLGTALFSPIINLAAGAESATDGDTSTNTNLTVDFGLFAGMALGNLVFNDVNNDGSFQSATETGISGMTVELLTGAGASFSPAVTTTTNASGNYSFTVYTNGAYRVRVSPGASLFTLASSLVGTDNATDNNNDGTQSAGAGSASTSFPFNMTAGGEPGTTGSGNTENTIDFGFRVCPAITVNPNPSLAAATVGTSYPSSVSATGGTAPYTFSVASGALPGWATLNPSTGAITGTPNNTSSATFTIRATDSLNCTGTRSYTITPTCPTITVTPSSINNALINASYTQDTAFSATGLTGTYSWSASGVPPGMTFNTSTRKLTGTPTASGVFDVIVTATDSTYSSCSGSVTVPVRVCATISISPAALDNATLGAAYTAALSATGGDAPYTFTITAGALPSWATMTNAGVITGTPNNTTPASFTVSVSDFYGCVGTRAYTLAVNTMSVGNVVWHDVNGNGRKDSGESGISGISVQLFNPGSDNAIGGIGGAADTQVGSTVTTGATGGYSFTGLAAGNYYVRVTPSTTYPLTGGNVDTADNRQDNDNNGSQPGGSGAAVSSPVVNLAPNAEPVNDGDTDANTDLTVDFGLKAADPSLVINSITPSAIRVEGGLPVYDLTVSLGYTNLPGTSVVITGQNFTLPGTTGTSVQTVVSVPVGVGAIASVVGSEHPRTRATACPTPPQAPACAATSVGGRVYREFNQNGALDAAQTASVLNDVGAASTLTYRQAEVGLPWAVVAIYGANGAVLGRTVSDAEGDWSFDASAVTGTQVIAEFTAYHCDGTAMSPSVRGSNNGTSVVFINKGNCTRDMTFEIPWEHSENEPPVAMSLFTKNGSAVDDVIITTAYNPSQARIIERLDLDPLASPGNYFAHSAQPPLTPHNTLARRADVGNVLGTAWSPRFKKLFVSSFQRPDFSAKSGKLGVIYAVDPAGGATQWLDLEALGISVGSWTDATDTGHVGLGGLSISNDGRKLYTVNLKTRQVHVIPINRDGTAPGSAALIKTFQIPRPGQRAGSRETPAVTTNWSFGQNHPMWAVLGVGSCQSDGRVYVSVTTTGPTSADVLGHVYSFDPANTDLTINAFRHEMEVDLSFDTRGSTTADLRTAVAWDLNNANPTEWDDNKPYHKWLGSPTFTRRVDGVELMHLPVRNRAWDNVSSTTEVMGGSLFVACRTTSSWVAESDGVCGPLTSAVPRPHFFTNYNSFPTLQGQGMFHEVFGKQGPSVSGTVLTAPGFTELLVPSMENAFGSSSHGIEYMSHANGGRSRDTYAVNGQAAGYSSTNPWGEGEILSTAAPLEIGNLVWSDDDDGVQEPGEAGIPGVTVRLYRDANGNGVWNAADVHVATAITDASGQYLFRRNEAGTTGIVIDNGTGAFLSGQNLDYETNYLICVDNAVDFAVGGAVAGATLSPANATLGGDANGTIDLNANDGTGTEKATGLAFDGTRDSDAVNHGSAQGSNVIALSTGGPGQNIHAYDIGIVPARMTIGNLVWHDQDKDGVKDTGESGLAGAEVRLFLDGGANSQNLGTFDTSGDDVQVGATIVTGSSGTYSFGGLLGGNYYIQVLPPATHPLAANVDTADNSQDGDNNADGRAGIPSHFYSPLISLAPGGEVTTDGDDFNGDLTVDFGFYHPGIPLTGCYSWRTSDTAANSLYNDPNWSGGAWPPASPGPQYHNGIFDTPSEWVPATNGNRVYAPNSHAFVDNLLLSYDAIFKRLTFDAVFSEVGANKVEGLWLMVTPGQRPLTNEHAILYVDGFDAANPHVSIYILDPAKGALSYQNGTAGLLASTKATGGAPITRTVTRIDATTVRIQFNADLSSVNNGSLWTGKGVNATTWAGLSFGNTAGVLVHPLDLTAAPTYDAAGNLTAMPATAASADTSFETVSSQPVATQTCPPMNIGNLVWDDFNNNGARDFGEPGMNNVRVQLFRPGTDALVNTSDDVQIGVDVFTNSQGAYAFDNLTPGDYFVKVTPPAGFAKSGGIPVTVDNSVDHDNNGTQPAGLGTALFSPIINLAVGQESTTDGDGNQGELTVDFGLHTGIQFGNLVWHDADNDGAYNSGTESGINGVVVDLLDANTNTVLASTLTNASGQYGFTVYSNGTYKVRVQPPPTFALASSVVDTADNAQDHDNNGAQPGGLSTPVTSPVITLTAGVEPGSGSNTNAETTIDFGLRQTVSVGNLVFKDVNNDGVYVAADDTVVSGVTVQLFNQGADPLTATPVTSAVTGASGTYLMSALPGTYFVFVPPSQFTTGAALENTRPTLAPATGVPDVDDGADQNALTICCAPASLMGVTTEDFTLIVGGEPTAASGETGYAATSDDLFDTQANLTVDLGFYPLGGPGFPLAGRVTRSLSTGSGQPLSGVTVSVYEDANGDGEIGANESAPVETTTTSSTGQYIFTVTSGDYIVSQEPLPGAVASADTDGGDPALTAVEIDDAAEANVNFAQSVETSTFAQWQEKNGLGGENGAGQNPDGDLSDNLIEYALGTDAADGTSARRFRIEENTQTGAVDAVLIRPVIGRDDVRYTLEGTADLNGTWTALDLTPDVTMNEDGTKTLCYAGVDAAVAETGFVRLKVALDADQNGTPEAEAASAVHGWSRRSFAAGTQQTLSIPLVKDERFAGKVASVQGGVLTLAGAKSVALDEGSYYIEVIGGAHEGHRIEVDEAASSGADIALDLTQSTLATVGDLAGARVVMRAHWTLGGALPAVRYHAAASPAQADRAMFFNNATNAFEVFWLCSHGGSARWVRDGDATLADAGTRIIAPAEGMMIHSRAQTATILITGQVRAGKFALPLKAGAQLIGGGHPVAMSPVSRGFTVANGFTASLSVDMADRIRVWNGDTTAATGYSTHYLHGTQSQATWVREGDSTLQDTGDENLFAPWRAAFITVTAPPASLQDSAP